MPDVFDCAIVGAGPAGLTAALYLNRFRRSVLIADGGPGRASWIPKSHNYPGFPDGVSGNELLDRLKRQAEASGPLNWAGRVQRLQRTPDGFWALEFENRTPLARTILLAMGVVDRRPPIENCDAAIRDAILRFCPICDGFEAMIERIAVVGIDDHSAREAMFLRTYSPNITLLMLGSADRLGTSARESLRVAGIPVVPVFPDSLVVANGRLTATPLDSKHLPPFEIVYGALGVDVQNELAIGIGAGVDGAGCLMVDQHQATTIEGIYAAGDMVRGLHQISVAIGEAAIAATAIHNRLNGA
jgi:thioredoxin reductase (NADPH)